VRNHAGSGGRGGGRRRSGKASGDVFVDEVDVQTGGRGVCGMLGRWRCLRTLVLVVVVRWSELLGAYLACRWMSMSTVGETSRMHVTASQ
jgi:hypothetical protein